MHVSMWLHVHISIFMSVFVSVSRAELRWATACCSAVTTPALVCIIYPPADWSRERHNHSNQSHARAHTRSHTQSPHTVRKNIGYSGMAVAGADLISEFICFCESPRILVLKEREMRSFWSSTRAVYSHAEGILAAPSLTTSKQTAKRELFFVSKVGDVTKVNFCWQIHKRKVATVFYNPEPFLTRITLQIPNSKKRTCEGWPIDWRYWHFIMCFHSALGSE